MSPLEAIGYFIAAAFAVVMIVAAAIVWAALLVVSVLCRTLVGVAALIVQGVVHVARGA